MPEQLPKIRRDVNGDSRKLILIPEKLLLPESLRKAGERRR